MKLKFWLGLFLSLIVSACVDPYEAQKPEPVVLEDRSHPQITIIYADENIKYYVPTMNRNIDNSARLPRLVVQLKNYAPQKLQVEYKCEWYDSYGANVSDFAPWQRLFMPANGEMSIVDMAKNPNASTVKVHLQYPSDRQIYNPLPDPAEQIYQTR